jgi:DNA invertase Pin-like site-specific DNA recombinase
MPTNRTTEAPVINPAQIALYARVSTTDCNQDPEVQLRELRAAAALRGLTVVAEYVDRGISGTKASRPELDRLMEDARSGKFAAVYVWKFDRFARSVQHLLRALDTFTRLDVSFVSLTEGFDVSTPVGKMIFTILGAVAELEHDVLIERTKAGMKNAAAKGVKLGRPRKVVSIKAAA